MRIENIAVNYNRFLIAPIIAGLALATGCSSNNSETYIQIDQQTVNATDSLTTDIALGHGIGFAIGQNARITIDSGTYELANPIVEPIRDINNQPTDKLYVASRSTGSDGAEISAVSVFLVGENGVKTITFAATDKVKSNGASQYTEKHLDELHLEYGPVSREPSTQSGHYFVFRDTSDTTKGGLSANPITNMHLAEIIVRK